MPNSFCSMTLAHSLESLGTVTPQGRDLSVNPYFFCLFWGSSLPLSLLSLPLTLLCCSHYTPPQINVSLFCSFLLVWLHPSVGLGPFFIHFLLSGIFFPCKLLLGISSKANFQFFRTLYRSKVSLEGKPWHSKHPGIFIPTESYSRDVCLSLVSRRLEWRKGRHSMIADLGLLRRMFSWEQPVCLQ